MIYLRVRNWDRYQHYKTGKNAGRLKWIKLQIALLRDPEFDRLPEHSQLHAIKILLLAAETDNHIAADPAWIARQIGAKSKIALQTLIESRFLEECPRTEDPSQILGQIRVEENREEETLATLVGGDQKKFPEPEPAEADPSPPTTASKKRTNGNGFHPPTIAEVDEYIAKNKIQNVDGYEFCSYWTSRNWIMAKGVKMANWKAAVSNLSSKRGAA